MTSPLTPRSDKLSDWFAHQMQQLSPFERNPHIAVAVSGGSDSMALCLLASDWAKTCGGMVTALIVDHQLRSTSTDEAKQTAEWLSTHGIVTEILTWEHDQSVISNIQETAREARYQLLVKWCKQHHVLHLLFGHQQEDVAETFLMRALRGSSIRGIAAMAALRYFRSVRILRPLLSCNRSTLRSWLTAQHQGWIDDPSNENPRFSRTHIRQLLLQMPQAIHATKRLADVASSAATTQQALDKLALPYLVQYVQLSPFGYATMKGEAWQKLPEALMLDILKRLVQMIGNGEVRFEKLYAVYKKLHTQSPMRLTFGGCLITQSHTKKHGVRLLICREPSKCAPMAWPEESACIQWDHRFMLKKSQPIAFQIRPFRPSDRRMLEEADPSLAKKLQIVPKSALLSIPVIEALDIMPKLPHIYKETPSSITIAFRPKEALT